MDIEGDRPYIGSNEKNHNSNIRTGNIRKPQVTAAKLYFEGFSLEHAHITSVFHSWKKVSPFMSTHVDTHPPKSEMFLQSITPCS